MLHIRYLTVALLSLTCFLSVHAHADATPPVVKVCVECHGMQGRAQVPGWPSLASMSYEEIKQKLVAYRAQRIPDSRMTEVAHILDDQDIDTVARFYADPSLKGLSHHKSRDGETSRQDTP